jgi:hypothetical protein
MPWYSAQLPLVETANLGNLQEAFLTAHLAAGRPQNMGMFCGPLDDEGTKLYFSPATASHPVGEAYLRTVRAAQCGRPPQGLTFLVGEEQALLNYLAGRI